MMGNDPQRRRFDALGFRQSLGHGILNSLVDFWPLGEQSGDRLGVHAGFTLTNTNSVSGGVGLGCLASQFNAASSRYLTRASQAELQTGNVDFTIAAWINPDAVSAAMMIVAKDNDTAGQREYDLFANTTIAKLDVFKATDVQVTEGNTVVLSAGSWFFVVGWFNATTGQASVEANANGTIGTSSTGNTLQAGSGANFRIGGRQYTGALSPFDGRIMRVGMWKRVLTANERTYLYNSGRGRDYPFV